MIEVADLGVLSYDRTRNRKTWLLIFTTAFLGGACGALTAVSIALWLFTPSMG